MTGVQTCALPILGAFRAFLDRFGRARNVELRHKLIEELRETGLYLAHLLLYHMHAEKETLYGSYRNELRAAERKELESRVRNYARKTRRSRAGAK